MCVLDYSSLRKILRLEKYFSEALHFFVDFSVETEEMDDLLLHCFLKSWKTSAKKLELPVLSSNFFRIHMVQNCPDGSKLDVKKSSYKKLSKVSGSTIL